MDAEAAQAFLSRDREDARDRLSPLPSTHVYRPKLAKMRTADYLKLLGMGHVFLGILAFLTQIGGL